MLNSIMLGSTVFSLLIANAFELQKKERWIDLLADNSLASWHLYLGAEIKGWKIDDGVLSTSGKNGDIVTNQEFENFELELEWKIEQRGNSGIFIFVVEHPDNKRMYQSGPEFQIIDNENYPQQLTEQQKTGSMSDVLAPSKSRSKPAGQWNKTRIVAHNGKVQHWLNKSLILEYQIGSKQLNEEIARSKFAQLRYAKVAKGKIGLQDHGNPVCFKNIRVRPIK
ncbi:3-keto-disaccharide hydrolase [Parapedobacter indicus]|nr:DUF1080 domain-containing protein [Parapedobacter indicus]